jgi:hypothetical protein
MATRSMSPSLSTRCAWRAPRELDNARAWRWLLELIAHSQHTLHLLAYMELRRFAPLEQGAADGVMLSLASMTSKPSSFGLDTGVLPDPIAVAELVRDFAQPLLYVDPAGPADIETMRTAVLLAMICWNLPVYEATGSQLAAKGTRALKAICEQVPAAVVSTVGQLLEDRKSKFAAAPFIVLVEVTGTTPENATIVAEARMLKTARASA